MSEVPKCPNCDSTLQLFYTGTVHCSSCESLHRGKEVDSDLTDQYDPVVQEVMTSDFIEAYRRYMELSDLFLKEPLGFPSEESKKEYAAVRAALPALFINFYWERERNKSESLKKEFKNVSRRI